MKKILLLVALIATVLLKPSFAQDTTKQSSLTSLLPAYYNVKNALVNSDVDSVALKAGDFIKTLNRIDMKSLPASDMSTFMAVQDKLAFDARQISKSKNLINQREYFADFSANFFKLAKAVKLTDQTIFYDYCPMKKSYWLSADAAIKNPYFGKQMLTCGKVTETLNK